MNFDEDFRQVEKDAKNGKIRAIIELCLLGVFLVFSVIAISVAVSYVGDCVASMFPTPPIEWQDE